VLQALSGLTCVTSGTIYNELRDVKCKRVGRMGNEAVEF
jgi:hypothetical protein